MDDFYFYSPCLGCGREMIRDMHGWRLVEADDPSGTAAAPVEKGQA